MRPSETTPQHLSFEKDMRAGASKLAATNEAKFSIPCRENGLSVVRIVDGMVEGVQKLEFN